MRGGSYLCILVPGALGSDLRSMLKAAGPTLAANAFETTLSLRDPIADRLFVRRVVGVNLGLQNAASADLSPTVQACSDDSKQLWLHAYSERCPDAWNALVGETNSACKRNVIEHIARLANCQTQQVDMWNFRLLRQDRAKLTAIIRVSSKAADILINSRDTTMFFRPFLAPGEGIVSEPGVTLVWANRCRTGQELISIASTLQRIKGFVANKQSLGV